MLSHKTIGIVITSLTSLLRNAQDDLYRAEYSFRGLSEKKMDEKYGESNDTPRQIIEGYRNRKLYLELALEEVRREVSYDRRYSESK